MAIALIINKVLTDMALIDDGLCAVHGVLVLLRKSTGTLPFKKQSPSMLVASFCTLPISPTHPATTTERYKSVRSVANGNRREEQVTRRRRNAV